MAELVVGRVPVLESLRAGKRKPRRLFLLSGGKNLEVFQDLARGAAIETRSRQELDVLAEGAVHQGVVLEADPLPVHDAERWARGPFPEDTVVLVLDGIEDPHNFGAIVRSAAAFAARAVIFGKDRSAPISPASVKSAAGGMEYVDLVRATNVVRALELIKKSGFWIVALDAEAPKTLSETDLRGRIALVVGSEGTGIRRLVQERCDFHAKIPLGGRITTLNASVSAAVALAECCRQRAVSDHPRGR